jgi:hypothetical protein
MKLLIIAGPYEADRLRNAAVSAGFETVAVEAGESLSGRITASQPDLIVMAPQVVHADPAVALVRVRSVPRGGVPIFLVGEAAEAPRMRGLADGFFVRPVSPELLLDRARSILGPPVAGGAAPRPDRLERADSRGASARPLRPQDAGELLAALEEGMDARIDALLDADLEAVIAAADAAQPVAPDEDPFDAQRTGKFRSLASAAAFDVDRSDAARERVLARYALIESGDYFAVLGISRDAGRDEVARARDAILGDLAPGALEPALARELAPQIDAVRTVATEAARVLCDEPLRRRYESRLLK